MITIGVVADPRRTEMAQRLGDAVAADYISFDSDRQGCTWNHRKVWCTLAELTEGSDGWCVVLEDDAVPVEGFREQLALALAAAPARIVSLYLGRGYIEDRYIESMLARAYVQGANWIVTHGRILHAVALAVHTDLMPSLVQNLPTGNQPIDRALSLWARREGHRVAYSTPSLVEHDDCKSLVTRYTRAERKAWRVGTRDQWCDKMMAMI